MKKIRIQLNINDFNRIEIFRQLINRQLHTLLFKFNFFI